MLTGRQKIDAAFSPAGTPHTPAVICYEGLYFRDHWDQLTACPWWYAQSPSLDHQLAWLGDVIDRTGQDWFMLAHGASRCERENVHIEERPDGVFRVDRRTNQATPLWRPRVAGWTDPGHVESNHPDHLPQTPAEIEAAIPLPPPEWRPDDAARAGCNDLAAELLARYGSKLFPIRHVAAPFWRCYGLWGFEGMMAMVADRPDLVEMVCRRSLVQTKRSLHEAAIAGVAGIWIEDCLSDMIGPAAFDRFVLSMVGPLVDTIRSLGMKSIYYFCGNPAGKWDGLLAIGADALSLEESKKGFTIDIEEVVARVRGRCVVLGNLDAMSVLPGAEGPLSAEIVRQLAAGRRNGGRFLMSLGSPVTPETPVARVRRYGQIVRELSPA